MNKQLAIIILLLTVTFTSFTREMSGGKKLKEGEGLITFDSLLYCNKGVPDQYAFYIEGLDNDVVQVVNFRVQISAWGGTDQWGYDHLFVLALPAGKYKIETINRRESFTGNGNEKKLADPIEFTVVEGQNKYLGKIYGYMFGKWWFIKGSSYYARYLIANNELLVTRINSVLESQSLEVLDHLTWSEDDDVNMINKGFFTMFTPETLGEMTSELQSGDVAVIQSRMEQWDDIQFNTFLQVSLNLPDLHLVDEYETSLEVYNTSNNLKKIAAKYPLQKVD
jgi:hypothetical protein